MYEPQRPSGAFSGSIIVHIAAVENLQLVVDHLVHADDVLMEVILGAVSVVVVSAVKVVWIFAENAVDVGFAFLVCTGGSEIELKVYGAASRCDWVPQAEFVK